MTVEKLSVVVFFRTLCFFGLPTSWVMRSFIAAVVLVELVFLRYSCIFNLLVLWVGGKVVVVSSGAGDEVLARRFHS